MVPQYRPSNVLILGYGGGTVAGLVRLLYGDVPITGVDIKLPDENRYGVTLVQADAKEYVKTCGHFDSVLIDLFSTDNCAEPCDFVTSKEFVSDLKRIANYVVLNTLRSKDLSAYDIFRRMGANKPSGSMEQIFYYEVNEPIPYLHPWK